MNNMKQLDVSTDYESIFALSAFAFQYKLNPEDLEKKKQEAARHIIWGIMEQDQIAAKLHLIPLSVYFNGEKFHMGGISAVATWPEFRRSGMVKQLLYHSLKYMKRHGQTISYLFPFSFAFYRKYGWEIAFADKKYTIPMERLSKVVNGNGYVRRRKSDSTLLNSIYSTYAKTFSGTLVRDENWWNERIFNEDNHIAVSYNEKDEANGYIRFNVNEDTMHVKEIAYTSMNGRNLLLKFIANHDSMAKKVEMTVPENDNLAFLLDEPRFEQIVNPYFMARIVDVHAFLQQFPFTDGNDTVTLHVTDDFFPENTGTYQLNQYETNMNVTFMNEGHAPKRTKQGVHCSIQKLTSMCLGYIRPMDLFEMQLIDGDKTEVEKLERIIPIQQTYFADFF